jgi:hypothetical protein
MRCVVHLFCILPQACTCTTRIGDEQEIFSLQWWFDYYLLTIVIVTVSTRMCKLRHCF